MVAGVVGVVGGVVVGVGGGFRARRVVGLGAAGGAGPRRLLDDGDLVLGGAAGGRFAAAAGNGAGGDEGGVGVVAGAAWEEGWIRTGDVMGRVACLAYLVR